MKAQMIATAETPVTVTALEGLLSCVLARMSGEFVTSGKLPGAAFPLANVGLLSCVCLEVQLHAVLASEVLIAPGEGACERFLIILKQTVE